MKNIEVMLRMVGKKVTAKFLPQKQNNEITVINLAVIFCLKRKNEKIKMIGV